MSNFFNPPSSLNYIEKLGNWAPGAQFTLLMLPGRNIPSPREAAGKLPVTAICSEIWNTPLISDQLGYYCFLRICVCMESTIQISTCTSLMGIAIRDKVKAILVAWFICVCCWPALIEECCKTHRSSTLFSNYCSGVVRRIQGYCIACKGIIINIKSS